MEVSFFGMGGGNVIDMGGVFATSNCRKAYFCKSIAVKGCPTHSITVNLCFSGAVAYRAIPSQIRLIAEEGREREGGWVPEAASLLKLPLEVITL